MVLTASEYMQAIETLSDQYKPEIVGLLTEIQTAWENEGLTVHSPQMAYDADDYSYALVVRTGGTVEDIVDFTIEIPEQRTYDGEGQGVSFGLTVTEYGGRVIAVRQPYNFTDAVWVDITNNDAVSHRWEEMRDWVQRDIDELIHQIRTKDYEGPLPGIL